MSGTFSKSSLPKRPGAYVNFSGEKAEPVITNPAGVVAIPVTHTWGPENTPTIVESFGEFVAQFTAGGTDTSTINESKLAPDYTNAYIAVKQAFRGEDYLDRNGAQQVIVYRIVNGDTENAARAMQNTASATAVTLTAKYGGTYGNRLKVSVFQNAADSTKNDLVIYDNVNTVELERYTHTKASISALVADINAKSSWVTATAGTTTTALAAVSLVSLTGGTDEAPTTNDYTDALDALEPYRFSLLAPGNLTDSTVISAIVAWAANLNNKGKRFLTVLGGGSNDDISAAVTRSEDINDDGDNDPNFVNLGVGRYLDDELGILTTAQLVPRVAGILADRGERQNLTFARLTGLDLYDGAPTESQILTAIDNGVVVIARDSNTVSPLRVEKGVTTYTLDTNLDKPYAIYSSPKYLRTMQLLEMEITEWAEGNVIGRLSINNDTRNYVLGQMRNRLQDRETAGIIQSGWSVNVDSSPAPTSTDEFVALSYSLTFGRSLEQILNTIVVG